MAKSKYAESLCSLNFALESCNALFDTIHEFGPRHPSACDLADALEELSGILDSLDKTTYGTGGTEFSLLFPPLQQCGRACEGFKQELLRYSSPFIEDRTKFRQWKKLRYHGSDIEGFKQLMKGYRLTVQVALLHACLYVPPAGFPSALAATPTTIPAPVPAPVPATIPANLTSREVSLTAEALKTHKALVQTAIDHLQACLDDEVLPEQPVTEGEHIIELENMEQEKAALECCIHVCQLFSEHLDHTESISARRVGLDEQDKPLGEHISVIENYGTGDAFQIMVSADGRALKARNEGHGWRIRQCGGHLSNFTTRHVSRDMSGTRLRNTSQDLATPDDVPSSHSGSVKIAHPSEFEKRWGRGFIQDSESGAGETSGSQKR